MTTRRLFLRGVSGALIFAPTVVSAASVMHITPTKAWRPELSSFDRDLQKSIDTVRRALRYHDLSVDDQNAIRKCTDDYCQRLYGSTFRPKNPNVARWLDS